MGKDKSKNNILSKFLKILYYIVTVFVCLIVFFLLYYVISAQLHAEDEDYKSLVSVYTIVSPSMTPVINVYDVVVNVRVDDPTDIQVGDIITYKSEAANSEGMTITHRVIEVSQLPDGTYEYMTQGDHNKNPDSLYVTFDNVIGKEIVIIPYIGRIQFLIANQKGWLVLLLIPVLIYFLKEIIKLVDLFNLRKRVDKVIGTTEDNFIEKKKLEKIANEEHKERIRKELLAKEHKNDSLQKNAKEPDNFLERYTETIVSVTENKYANTIKPSREVVIEENVSPKVIAPSKAINTKQIKEEKIEILDTDELTSKIKEYDDRLNELDKILKKVEKKKEEKVPKTIVEKNDYLEGEKIKVISMVPAKSYMPNKKVRIGFNDMLPTYSVPQTNERELAIRPFSEDINEVRNMNEPKNKQKAPKNKNLNLNPNNVKKVNRPNRKKSNNQNRRNSKQLNLNPNEVKKVNRPNRRRKRPPLIVIEKKSKTKWFS